MPKKSTRSARQRKATPKKPTKPTSVAATTNVTAKHLPGYLRFSREVLSLLWQNRRIFIPVWLGSWAIVLLASAFSQQGFYADLTYSTQDLTSSLPNDALKTFIEVMALFASLVTGSLNSALSEVQLVYVWVTYLFVWLVTIWLLRHRLAKTVVKVRDALYSAGGPIVPTLLLLFIGFVQLFPLLIMVVLVNAFVKSAILSTALAAVIGVVVLVLLGVVTLYWLITTLFALVIVTIPGTYPMSALRSARNVAKGHRFAMLKRLLWLVLIAFVASLVLVVPFIYLDALVGYQVDWLPASVFQLVSLALLVYGSAYVYLLYRKMINARA